ARLDLSVTRPAVAFDLVATQQDGGVVEISADGTMPLTGPRELVLRRAVVDLVEGRWTLMRPATFDWGGSDGLVVTDFEMRETGSDGRIVLDGRVLPLDRIDARIDVARLPVGDIQELIGVTPVVSGLLAT